MKRPSLSCFVLAVFVAAPAGAVSGSDVARAAEARVGKRGGLLRNDCSGFVMTVLDDVGVERRGNTAAFWERAVRDGRAHHGTPRPGDLAFFDHTYDANRNGRVDDPLSHIAVVVGVDDDGRIRMVHRGSGKITELFATPKAPGVHQRKGRVLNSFLRAPGYGPKDDGRLAANLLRGFARPPVTSGSAPAKIAKRTHPSAKAAKRGRSHNRPKAETAKPKAKRPEKPHNRADQRWKPGRAPR